MPAPHWTVAYLVSQALEQERQLFEIERQAELTKGNIGRWVNTGRVPHIDDIDKALNAIGYRIGIVKL